MDKNELVMAFSYVCGYIADNIETILLPHLDDEQLMITPHFTNAHIVDMNQWWETDNHFPRYLLQIEDLASDDPNSRQENIDAGIEEIQENPMLWKQLKSLMDGSDAGVLAVLKHIPHVAQYATCLTVTDGYKKLDALTEQMDNVFIWPMVTLNNEANDLKSAFYVNVSIISGNGGALKPKLQKLHRFNA